MRLRRNDALRGAKAAPEGKGVGLGSVAAATPLDGFLGPSRALGNQWFEVPPTICARPNLRSGWLTAQQRPHETQCLVVNRVDYVGPFPHRRDPRQLDPH